MDICIGMGRQWISFGEGTEVVLGLTVQSSCDTTSNYNSSMALRFSEGGYVAQIFAYESDILRLLRDVQLHVAAGHALYAAVFLCRYSEKPSVTEKRAISKAAPSHVHLDQDQRIDSASPGNHALPRGDLTLTLFHVDTTWRFDTFDTRRASPKLSWPTIRKFFTPGSFVEGDLILRDQHCHPDALRTLRKLHVPRGLTDRSLTKPEQHLLPISYI